MSTSGSLRLERSGGTGVAAPVISSSPAGLAPPMPVLPAVLPMLISTPAPCCRPSSRSQSQGSCGNQRFATTLSKSRDYQHPSPKEIRYRVTLFNTSSRTARHKVGIQHKSIKLLPPGQRVTRRGTFYSFPRLSRKHPKHRRLIQMLEPCRLRNQRMGFAPLNRHGYKNAQGLTRRLGWLRPQLKEGCTGCG